MSLLDPLKSPRDFRRLHLSEWPVEQIELERREILRGLKAGMTVGQLVAILGVKASRVRQVRDDDRDEKRRMTATPKG